MQILKFSISPKKIDHEEIACKMSPPRCKDTLLGFGINNYNLKNLWKTCVCVCGGGGVGVVVEMGWGKQKDILTFSLVIQQDYSCFLPI